MKWHLKLDWDDGFTLSVPEIETRLDRAGFNLQRIDIRVSPSGEGWHVRLIVDPEPDSALEVVALQSVLGSDPYREACNIQRVRTLPMADDFWGSRWNVLYTRRKGEK